MRKATPRAALLSTLAGIALGFISFGFLFRAFAHPIVGLTTFGVVMLTYFGRVRFKGHLPGGLVAIVARHAARVGDRHRAGRRRAGAGVVPPARSRSSAISSPRSAAATSWPYLSVIVAMGLFNVLGSLQNIESAEAAGDLYDTRPSLMVNGLGSIAAALFGSAFPTTIYIGHPGWKALGARAGYSVLNGVVHHDRSA